MSVFSWRVNVLPLAGVLVTLSLALRFSASFWAMDRPRPWPGTWALVRDVSAR